MNDCIRRAPAVLLGLAVLFLAGCGQAPVSSGGGPVSIQVGTPDDVQAKIAEQRGKIVVVDTWATWCPPCVAEFPELVQIHDRLGQEGVVCMSVSIDKVRDRDKALAFLKAKGAAFPNFLMEDPASWGSKWNIQGIPMVLVFGPDGQMIRRFDRDGPTPFTYADVEQFAREQLRKGG